MYTWAELHALMALSRYPVETLTPNYNVAPTHMAPVVRRTDDGLEGLMMRWGLIPSWWNKPEMPRETFNAVGETLTEKPSYRAAFKSRRCVVPVSSFIEWVPVPGKVKEQPHLIHRVDQQPLFLAGLWEEWTKGPEPVLSFTIITTPPNQFVKAFHHRMPAILDDASMPRWMDIEAGTDGLQSLIRPAPEDLLVMTPAVLPTKVAAPTLFDAS